MIEPVVGNPNVAQVGSTISYVATAIVSVGSAVLVAVIIAWIKKNNEQVSTEQCNFNREHCPAVTHLTNELLLHKTAVEQQFAGHGEKLKTIQEDSKSTLYVLNKLAKNVTIIATTLGIKEAA